MIMPTPISFSVSILSSVSPNQDSRSWTEMTCFSSCSPSSLCTAHSRVGFSIKSFRWVTALTRIRTCNWALLLLIGPRAEPVSPLQSHSFQDLYLVSWCWPWDTQSLEPKKPRVPHHSTGRAVCQVPDSESRFGICVESLAFCQQGSSCCPLLFNVLGSEDEITCATWRL